MADLKISQLPTTTLPTVEGTYIYHDTWKCMVGFNGTKVCGFTEWANYVASAASISLNNKAWCPRYVHI